MRTHLGRARRSLAIARFALVLIGTFGAPAIAQEQSMEDLQRTVEKLAPPSYTLPGKILCACRTSQSIGNSVGYLNSLVTDHGTYSTVDVWCVYNGFSPAGNPVFTTACGDFRLLKK